MNMEQKLARKTKKGELRERREDEDVLRFGVSKIDAKGQYL